MAITIDEPLRSQSLWRYMSLEKLLALLQSRCLYFSQLQKFRDPYEGTTPTGMQIGVMLNGEDQFLDYVKDDTARQEIYVNCWHANQDESAAMWSLYSRESGVAVRTTGARLEKALQCAECDISIAPLRYEPPSPNLLAGCPWQIKRPSFAHEREVRAVLRIPGCEQPGVAVGIDPDMLIEDVHVSPDAESWIEGVVRNVVQQYGCAKPVRRSALYELV